MHSGSSLPPDGRRASPRARGEGAGGGEERGGRGGREGRPKREGKEGPAVIARKEAGVGGDERERESV